MKGVGLMQETVKHMVGPYRLMQLDLRTRANMRCIHNTREPVPRS